MPELAIAATFLLGILAGMMLGAVWMQMHIPFLHELKRIKSKSSAQPINAPKWSGKLLSVASTGSLVWPLTQLEGKEIYLTTYSVGIIVGLALPVI